MDNCRMNYTVSRSCRMHPGNFNSQEQYRQTSWCGCDKVEDTDIYVHVDKLPLTMAYVPRQKFEKTFELCKALQMGTIFPELCKPFCGRRCGCR